MFRYRATLKTARRWLAVWVVAAAALPAAATEPSRVGDFETSYMADRGFPLALQRAGNVGIYLAHDLNWGRELWATDGTAGGTRLLRSLCLDSNCSLAGWGSTAALAFIAMTDEREVRLWRSDGSTAGTFPLTPALRNPDGGWIEASVTIAGPFAYLALTGADWSAVWSSDGTLAGTRLLAEVAAPLLGSSAVGEDFYWYARPRLWRGSARDGAVELLQELDDDVEAMVDAGDRLVFFVESAWTRTLWTSDGSVPGTQALERFPISGQYTEVGLLVSLGGRAWFVADGPDGVELWSTDGTAAGTRPATAFRRPRPFGQDPWNEGHLLTGMLAQVGSRVLFPVGPYEKLRLWTTNGHARQARPLAGCAGGCPYVAPYGLKEMEERVAFLGWREGEGLALWITDGSPAGTVRLAGLDGAEYGELHAAGGLWFVVDEWGETRVSDGTPGGTRRMTVVPQLWDDDGLLPLGSAVLFAATTDTDGDYTYTTALWRTDGRSETEVLSPPPRAVSALSEIVAAAGERVVLRDDYAQFWGADAATLEQLPREATGFGGADYVDAAAAGERAYLVVSREGTFTWGKSFWSSDGTAAGTVPIRLQDAKVWGAPVPLPGTTDEVAYFETSDSIVAGRLLSTDGTPAGTRELLAVTGGRASDLVAGEGELAWVMTDAAGATLWGLDLATGERGAISPPLARMQPPVALGGTFYALGEAQEGQPVLVVAAVGAAPRLLPLHERGVASADRLAVVGGRLWFPGRASDDERWRHWLWTSDGTMAGTLRLPVEISLAGMSPVSGPGGAVYFAGIDGADGAGDRELWRSDGTIAGTARVLDLQPGPGDGGPTGRAASWRGRLFFAADDGPHGVELWSTDGTAGGTRLEAELQPGPLGSFPGDLTVAGDRLFFTAYDDERGRQLYVLTPTP